MKSSSIHFFSVVLILLGIVPSIGFSQTFEVNRYTDSADINVGDGICDSALATSIVACSLRAAIQEANANEEDDIIILPSGDTGSSINEYRLTIPNNGLPDNLGLTGDFDIINDSITIRGEGPEVSVIGFLVTTSYYEGVDRIFDVHPEATLILEDMQIREGRTDHVIDAYGGITENEGGGIRSIQSTVILNNVYVTENQAAGLGSGIYSLVGYLEINDSQIFRNNENIDQSDNLTGVGTGITLNGGRALIRNTLIWDNPRQYTRGGQSASSDTPVGVMPSLNRYPLGGRVAIMGGGIFSFGDITIENSAIIGNRSMLDGGGIYHGVGELILRNTTISGNVADRSGGGLYVKRTYVGAPRGAASNIPGASTAEPPINLLHTTIINNYAIGWDYTDEGVFNGITAGFPASTFGGYEGPSLVGVLGGHDIAISGQTGQPSVNLSMASSIVGSCLSFMGTVQSFGNNLSVNSDCALTLSSDRMNTDPLLNPIAYNGSERPTYKPLPASYAIDNASDWYCSEAVTDQRGMVRPLTQCDIGAYEEVPFTAFSQLYSIDIGEPLTDVLRTNYVKTDNLTYEIVTPATKGDVGIYEPVGLDDIDGQFTYRASLSSTGMDSFTFRVTDTSTGEVSNTALVSININAQAGPMAPTNGISVEVLNAPPGTTATPLTIVSDSQLSAEVADVDFDFPIGVFFFSVKDIPIVNAGDTFVQVRIQLAVDAALLPANAVVRKYDKFGRWRTLSSAWRMNESYATFSNVWHPTIPGARLGQITLTLRDNDVYDNNDILGIINDPIAIGIPSSEQQKSTGNLPDNIGIPNSEQQKTTGNTATPNNSAKNPDIITSRGSAALSLFALGLFILMLGFRKITTNRPVI